MKGCNASREIATTFTRGEANGRQMSWLAGLLGIQGSMRGGYPYYAEMIRRPFSQ